MKHFAGPRAPKYYFLYLKMHFLNFGHVYMIIYVFTGQTAVLYSKSVFSNIKSDILSSKSAFSSIKSDILEMFFFAPGMLAEVVCDKSV